MKYLALACMIWAAAAGGELQAGAAKREITPDFAKHGRQWIAGFGNGRQATGVRDPLWARCLALTAGAKPLVFCGVDSIGLFFDDVLRIRKAVGERAQVVVAALHDHEAPDTMGLWGPKQGVTGINEAYNTFVIEQTAAAADEALRGMRPATALLGKIHKPELDDMIDDTRPPKRHDNEIVTLALNDAAGKRIATLVNWANHPEARGSKNTLISADYPEALYQRVEELAGGVAVLINGAVGGMQSPLGAKIGDPLVVGRRAGELALEGLQPARIDAMEYRETEVLIPLANQGFVMAAKANLYNGRKPMREDGMIATPVGYARLSGGGQAVLEIAMIPGEMYPELSIGGIERYSGADFPEAPLETPIKTMFRAPYRMLFGLANDEIGYIIPKCEWDEKPPYLNGAAKRWYGEVNAVGPEAAPRIADAMRKLTLY